jgi:hypothetical protein
VISRRLVWNMQNVNRVQVISCLRYHPFICALKSFCDYLRFQSTQGCMFVVFCVYVVLLKFLEQVFCVVISYIPICCK